MRNGKVTAPCISFLNAIGVGDTNRNCVGHLFPNDEYLPTKNSADSHLRCWESNKLNVSKILWD